MRNSATWQETSVANYLTQTLPMPVVAAPGAVVNLKAILSQDFGSSLGGYSDYWLAYYGAAALNSWDFSYWNPSSSSVARWYVNNSDIGPADTHNFNQAHVLRAQVATADLHAGNDIGPLAYMTVPNAGPTGNATEYIQYSIITIDPALMSATAWTGNPNPADVVATAKRFAAAYVNVPNDNDCHNIASAVAAATGATLTYATGNTNNPALNESGGFWRVVYRGSDPNPVANWQTLVQPGDIVRMGWQSGGPHTTTVLARNADGSLQVYDNSFFDSHGTELIGIHDNVRYDAQTIASSITIYRLSPDHLYLINGSNGQVQGETLNGNLFNDVFDGISGNDTVNGGAEWDEAILHIASSAATIHHTVGGATVSYSGFTDTFNNVEVLKFTDKTVALRTRARADFDNSGTSDILFRNAAGDTWLEGMSNGVSTGWHQVGGSDRNYAVVGEGHFYGSGASDVLYRNNATGDTWFAAMSNGAFAGWHQIGGSDTRYSVAGVGDFDGNGTSDILYRNASSGDTWLESISGGDLAGWRAVGGSDTNYSVAGVGDFDGDGTSDILFRNGTNGDEWFAQMSNGALAGWRQIGGSDTRYSVVGVADFYGNGTDDILFRNNATGDTWFEAMNAGASAGWHQVGGSDTRFSVVGVGDYFGDGTSDILYRNNASGDTWFAAMSNGSFSGWHQVGGSDPGYSVKI
jgi:FG-GAP-like repeat